MSTRVLKNLRGSVQRFTLDLLEQATAEGLPARWMDWDAHADIHKLPEVDLFGPTAFSVIEDDRTWMVNFAVAVSTYDDAGLFRMRDLLDLAFEAMRPEKRVTYYDAETADPRGTIIFTNDTVCAPMTRASSRPFQFVQASGLLPRP